MAKSTGDGGWRMSASAASVLPRLLLLLLCSSIRVQGATIAISPGDDAFQVLLYAKHDRFETFCFLHKLSYKRERVRI